MFGFTAELGNLLLDAITFNPPAELKEAAGFYTTVASSILNVFPEIAAQVTKNTGKMLIHHTALKASPAMALEAIKMVTRAYPAGAWSPDAAGALPLHWITHNSSCNYELVSYLISANPKAPWVADVDGYLPLHWAVNQNVPNVDVVAALLTANPSAASKACNKGSLPLHWCVNREGPLLGVVQALLQAHPDAVRTFCDEGWLPIHRSVDRSNISTETLRLLVDLYPQGLQCRNSDGQLPLHRALDHQYPSEEAVEFMLAKYPGSAQVQDDEGYLPLHMALDCAAPSPLIVRLILDAYPEAAFQKSRDGLLPLHCAVSCVNPLIEVVESLLEIFPESPEHIAMDIVPMDEYADPDTWAGEWKEKRWTPLSRAVDRKLDPVVALFKAALNNSLVRRRTDVGSPVKVINLATSKRLVQQAMPPINAVLTDVDDQEGAEGNGPGATLSPSVHDDHEPKQVNLLHLQIGQGPINKFDNRDDEDPAAKYGKGYGPDKGEHEDQFYYEDDVGRSQRKDRRHKDDTDRGNYGDTERSEKDRHRSRRDRSASRDPGRDRDRDRDRERRHRERDRDRDRDRHRHRDDRDRDRSRGERRHRRSSRRHGDEEEDDGPGSGRPQDGVQASGSNEAWREARPSSVERSVEGDDGPAGGGGGEKEAKKSNPSLSAKYFDPKAHRSPNEPPPKVMRDAAALQEHSSRPKSGRGSARKQDKDDLEMGGIPMTPTTPKLIYEEGEEPGTPGVNMGAKRSAFTYPDVVLPGEQGAAAVGGEGHGQLDGAHSHSSADELV
jgi:ankyrin repeat protein